MHEVSFINISDDKNNVNVHGRASAYNYMNVKSNHCIWLHVCYFVHVTCNSDFQGRWTAKVTEGQQKSCDIWESRQLSIVKLHLPSKVSIQTTHRESSWSVLPSHFKEQQTKKREIVNHRWVKQSMKKTSSLIKYAFAASVFRQETVPVHSLNFTAE